MKNHFLAFLRFVGIWAMSTTIVLVFLAGCWAIYILFFELPVDMLAAFAKHHSAAIVLTILLVAVILLTIFRKDVIFRNDHDVDDFGYYDD